MTFPKSVCGCSFHPHLLFFHSSVMFSTDDTGATITGNCCSITYRRHYAGDPVGSRRHRAALSYHHYASNRGNKICGRQQQHTAWWSLQQQFRAKSMDADWVLGMFCIQSGSEGFCPSSCPTTESPDSVIYLLLNVVNPYFHLSDACRSWHLEVSVQSAGATDFLWHGYCFLSTVSCPAVSDLVSVFWPLWEMALGEKKEKLPLLWWCEKWPSLQPLFHCRDLKEREERKASLAHLEPLDPLVPKDPLEMTVQRATL